MTRLLRGALHSAVPAPGRLSLADHQGSPQCQARRDERADRTKSRRGGALSATSHTPADLRQQSVATVTLLASPTAWSPSGLENGPPVAGRGVVRVAVGSGAQTLVKDIGAHAGRHASVQPKRFSMEADPVGVESAGPARTIPPKSKMLEPCAPANSTPGARLKKEQATALVAARLAAERHRA
jgi:hypothetical protein